MLVRPGRGLFRGTSGGAPAGLSAQTGVGAATWTGPAPTINGVGWSMLPGYGQATWTGPSPTVTLPVSVASGVGAATWTGPAPTVSGLVSGILDRAGSTIVDRAGSGIAAR